MCGIAGIVCKNSDINISGKLIEMLSLIQHRGPDAAGIAVFGDYKKIMLRVTLAKDDAISKLHKIIEKYGEIIDEKSTRNVGKKLCMELLVDVPKDKIKKIHNKINANSDMAVHSFSDDLKVYKEGGEITNLISNYKVDNFIGNHGIGHVRMATESAEDVNAAHPFVSPFYPELAIVHNGQFTNYFNMRRFLESKGAKFKTLNDSEAASHLIAYYMQENGGDLEDALKKAGDHMDGIFCIIASTPTQLGFVKDKLGIKPMLVAETPDMVMLGSEQIEFSAIDDGIFADEMEPGEVRVWNI